MHIIRYIFIWLWKGFQTSMLTLRQIKRKTFAAGYLVVLGALPSLLAMAAALWLVSLLDKKSSKGEFFKQIFGMVATRSAATSYKWSYNPYKRPYKWVTGVVTPMYGVTTLLTTGTGPPRTNPSISFNSLPDISCLAIVEQHSSVAHHDPKPYPMYWSICFFHTHALIA